MIRAALMLLLLAPWPLMADDRGIVVHPLTSPYQAGATEVRVLLPQPFDAEKKYRVVYVLPVEAGREARWGDGLREVQQLDLHNKHRLIVVAPTFSALPWYCDHPTDPAMRQESHFVNAVVPLVDRTYPTSSAADDRLLLGFSKSGCGAWSLMLRHPELFGRASAWDSPLMMQESGKYGSGPIFGTQANFERYRLADLLRGRALEWGESNRLVLTGYGNFHDQHQQMHALLDELKIAHDYRDGPRREHTWHSGWVREAFELLIAATGPSHGPRAGAKHKGPPATHRRAFVDTQIAKSRPWGR
ncbi:MAG TPA: alpha/beta hydrolase-fold protein [Pirellulales bacterium]|nr:alpha/beta hydrolase-fold protein [Pirellulales bacterium]